jgi:serine/threonine protein kinase
MPSPQEILSFFGSKQEPDEISDYPTSVFFKGDFRREPHGNEPKFPDKKGSPHLGSNPEKLECGTVPGFIQSGGYGCTYLVKLNSGEVAVAKVMLHPTKPEQSQRLAVDLAGMTQIPPVPDGRSSLIRLLHLSHTSRYICMIVTTVRTTPISADLAGVLQEAYGNCIPPSNWGFVKDVYDWIYSKSIPFNGPRPYIILKQLLEAVNRLHKGSIIHRDIKAENVVVGVELDFRRDQTTGELIVTEKWNTMLIDLGWSKMLKSGNYQMPVSGGGGTAQAAAGAPPTSGINFEAKLDQNPSLPTSFEDTAPVSGWPAGWHTVLKALDVNSNDKATEWITAELMAADIWACGLVFATMLFGMNPISHVAENYAHDIFDEDNDKRMKKRITYAIEQWPEHQCYQNLLKRARRTHGAGAIETQGSLWEYILMRMMPPKGDMRAYVSAEDLLREPLLGAFTGEYTYRPPKPAQVAPVAIFNARGTPPPPVAEAAPAEPPATRGTGGRALVNELITKPYEEKKETEPAPTPDPQ